MAVFLATTLVTYNWIEEDAYIYFRVAENLASGHGYVFNLGEGPIETGSSPIWQLLLVAFAWLPLEMVTLAKLAGIGFGIAALAEVTYLARRSGIEAFLVPVPALLLALYSPFVLWAHSGMETAMYTFLVLWYVLWAIEAPTRSRWVVPAVMLAIARPESFLLLFSIIGIYMSVDGPAARRRVLRSGCLVVLAFGLLLAIRFYMFGDLVAFPFYIKGSQPQSLRNALGLLLETRLWLAVAVILFAAGCRSYWTRERLVVWATGSILVAWGLLTHDGLKPYHRHLVPALPFLCWGAVDGICFLSRTLFPRRTNTMVLAVSSSVLVAAIALDPQVYGTMRRSAPNPIHSNVIATLQEPSLRLRAIASKISSSTVETPVDQTGLHQLGYNYQALVGKFIERNYPKGITVVYDQMGQTPYFSGSDKRFLDVFGLTDRIAGMHYFNRRRGDQLTSRAYLWAIGVLDALFGERWNRTPTEQQVSDHFLESQPALVLLNAFSGRELKRYVLTDPRFRERYRTAFQLGPPQYPPLLTVYESLELPARTTDDLIVPRGLIAAALPGAQQPEAPL